MNYIFANDFGLPKLNSKEQKDVETTAAYRKIKPDSVNMKLHEVKNRNSWSVQVVGDISSWIVDGTDNGYSYLILYREVFIDN